ncbi:MAG TPA: hypothetical protein VMY37_22015, partial [Thermoguttaceae bacterium]|nr:hypothetical protein [Thermoguttaceae bacterium]
LLFGWNLAAYIQEALFLSALAALVFGRFCLGSFIFHIGMRIPEQIDHSFRRKLTTDSTPN